MLVAFVSVARVSAQEPNYTLKVDVPYVSVDVTVADAAGEIITNLPSDAFELYENGVRQDIRYFASVATPYNVLLLFDRSGSTQDKWPLMQRAVAAFIAGLRPQDRISIAAFDSDLKTLLPWTADRGEALRTLPLLTLGNRIGGTEFYSSVAQTLRRNFGKTNGRRALVVLSDGRDSSLFKWIVNKNRLPDIGEERPFQNVLKIARIQRIPIYFVAFNTDKNLQPNMLGGDEYRNLRVIFPRSDIPGQYLAAVRVRMEQLSEAAGGRVLYPERLDDIVALYEKIAQELGTSYGIGYISPNATGDGSFRRIEVRTRNPEFKLTQSRNGYYAK
jgi:VWFA-related protein